MKKIFFIALFLPIVAMGQITSDDALIAFYPFNGNANDESGYGNNGEVYGAVLTTDRFGNENSAYEFDGSSSYISIPNSESLQSPLTELTQVAWIYMYSWGNGGNWAPVLMKSHSGDNSFQYRLAVGTNGINTSINNWNNAVIIPDTLEFNAWYMVATTLKDDTVRAYVNGELKGEGTLSNGYINLDTKPLEIGIDVPGGIEYYDGKIDDIYIYNRALSSVEINNLYTGENWIHEDKSKSETAVITFPSPFQNRVTFEYKLTRPGDVSIELYNQFGMQVNRIELKQSSGMQQVIWTPDLPDGIYYFRLETGERVTSGKIMKLSRN